MIRQHVEDYWLDYVVCLLMKRASDSRDPKRLCMQTNSATAVKKRNLEISRSAKLGITRMTPHHRKKLNKRNVNHLHPSLHWKSRHADY